MKLDLLLKKCENCVRGYIVVARKWFPFTPMNRERGNECARTMRMNFVRRAKHSTFYVSVS